MSLSTRESGVASGVRRTDGRGLRPRNARSCETRAAKRRRGSVNNRTPSIRRRSKSSSQGQFRELSPAAATQRNVCYGDGTSTFNSFRMPEGTGENAHLIFLTDDDEVRGRLAVRSLGDSVRGKCSRAWKGWKYMAYVAVLSVAPGRDSETTAQGRLWRWAGAASVSHLKQISPRNLVAPSSC